MKANCCPKKQKAIKKAKEERHTWNEREGECQNVMTNQQEKPKKIEEGVSSTEEAEKKALNDELKEKDAEVQVVSTQDMEGECSNPGIPETPMRRW